MIGFELSTGEVVTARINQSVEFELNSPALEAGLIPGNHSLELSIDDVDGNMVKLKQANRQDRLTRETIFSDVHLVLLGLKEYTGKLVIRRVRENGVDAFLVINGFSIDIINLLLSEVDYGADVNLGSTSDAISTAAGAYVSQNYPDVNFNFPTIYAPNFYGGKALGWHNAATSEPFDEDAVYTQRMVVLWTDGYCYVCVEGTTAGQNPTTHPAKWTALLSNGLLNNWIDSLTEFHINDKTYMYTQNAQALSPQLYDKFVLKQLGSSIGYRITGEFIKDARTDQSMLLNTRALDKLPTAVVVKAEQDAVNDPDTNDAADGTIYLTGDVGGTGYYLHFNNEITDPDDDWTVVDPSPTYASGPPSYYTIHSEGVHRIFISLDIVDGASDPPYTIVTQVNGIYIDNFEFTGVGTVQRVFEWFAPAGNIGDKIAFQIVNSSSLGAFEIGAGSFVQIENMSANQYNEWNGVVSAANHVPDVTVGDYLLSLKNRFNLSISLNFFEREIKLNYAASILDREPNDMTDVLQTLESDVQDPQGCTITENPNVDVAHSTGSEYTIAATYINYSAMVAANGLHGLNDVVYVTSQFAFYRLGQYDLASESEWQFLASKLPPLVYGNGSRKIRMIDQPAQMAYVYNDDEFLLVPWFNTKGNTGLFGADKQTMPIVHAMWYGLQDDESGNREYPFASSAIYDAPGQEIGNVDLRFVEDLPESVWELWFKEWIRRVDFSLTFEADAFLNYKQIFELDFDSPIRRRFVKYVMRKVLYEVGQSGKIEAEIQAVKIAP